MKRDTHLRALSSEHHQALALSRDIQRACQDDEPPADLINRIRSVFQTELQPHFEAEEQTLLPALEAAGQGELVRRTLDEHQELQQLVDDLEQPGNPARFAEALKAHVRFEEKVLFEVSQQVLDETALAAVGHHSRGRTE